jgi:hypothetical protein
MFASVPKKALSLTVTGAIAAMLVTGCSPNPEPEWNNAAATDDYIQICQDLESDQRVEDEKCDDAGSATRYQPSYYHYDSMIPAIGAALLVGHLLSPPRNSTVYRGAVPKTGGYAPSVRPNSGFLKVPDSFVGGPPPIPKAPTSVPVKAAATPPSSKVAPPQDTRSSTESKTDTKSSTNSGKSSGTKSGTKSRMRSGKR